MNYRNEIFSHCLYQVYHLPAEREVIAYRPTVVWNDVCAQRFKYNSTLEIEEVKAPS